MIACGIATSGEEGVCSQHAADILSVPKHRVHYLATTGVLELWPAAKSLTCGVKRHGNCLIQVGDLLEVLP